MFFFFFFFFSSRRRHTRWTGDWSSDVCSSDLGVPGLAERGWPGRRLRIGDALIGALKLRQRCVMTTYDPETLEQDVGVLRGIQREFGGLLALDCFVERGASIVEGDRVELES